MESSELDTVLEDDIVTRELLDELHKLRNILSQINIAIKNCKDELAQSGTIM